MLDAYRDLIDELLETPTALRDAIAANQNAAVMPKVATEIALIRDRDVQVLERARAMVQRPDAFLDDSTPIEAIEEAPFDQVMAEMEIARGDLVSLLINLSLKDWERTAILKSGAEVMLSDMIEGHVEFDEAARARVREVLQGA